NGEKKRRQDDRSVDRAATKGPKPEHERNSARAADDDHGGQPDKAVSSPHRHGEENERGTYRPSRNILPGGDLLHDRQPSCAPCVPPLAKAPAGVSEHSPAPLR